MNERQLMKVPMARTDDEPKKRDRGPRAAKTQKYVTPRLIEYGSTAKLTASKPGSQLDGSNSIHMT